MLKQPLIHLSLFFALGAGLALLNPMAQAETLLNQASQSAQQLMQNHPIDFEALDKALNQSTSCLENTCL